MILCSMLQEPTSKAETQSSAFVVTSGVSRVWQAWHVPWAPHWRGRKNCLAKITNFIYSFLNLYIFAPHTTINSKAASTQCAHI